MGKHIGQSVPRYEGLGQVTGAAVYNDDHYMPGMLYARPLRSPVHKGILKGMDLSAAEKIPGVVGVVTIDDVPGSKTYGLVPDQPVFVIDQIRYKGERLAAVVALDEDTAQAGVEALAETLDIEEQEPVFDIFKAMEPGAPLVRPDTEDNMWVFGNGKTTFEVKLGDIEKGFEEADEIVETEVYNATNDHSSIEPHSSLAYIDDAGRLVVHTDSQALYFHMGILTAVLDIPQSQLRYVGGRVGGGFGGKNDIHTDHVASIAALKFGKPVKYRLNRREDMAFTTKRGPYYFKVKDGVKKDGTIVARHFQMWHDAGGYTAFAPYAVEKCATFGLGPYAVPNVLVEGWCVYTNKPPASSQRGFAVTNGQSCIELHMSRVAEALGKDPWEIRFLNAWHEGDLGPTRYPVVGAGAIEALQKAAELAGVDLPDRFKKMSSQGG